jgi:hypothetical protein
MANGTRMIESCSFCRRDISREIPHSTFPDLCAKCAAKEVKRIMKTRGTQDDQRKLF